MYIETVIGVTVNNKAGMGGNSLRTSKRRQLSNQSSVPFSVLESVHFAHGWLELDS